MCASCWGASLRPLGFKNQRNSPKTNVYSPNPLLYSSLPIYVKLRKLEIFRDCFEFSGFFFQFKCRGRVGNRSQTASGCVRGECAALARVCAPSALHKTCKIHRKLAAVGRIPYCALAGRKTSNRGIGGFFMKFSNFLIFYPEQTLRKCRESIAHGSCVR